MDRKAFEMVRNKLMKAWRLALKSLKEEADYTEARVV